MLLKQFIIGYRLLRDRKECEAMYQYETALLIYNGNAGHADTEQKLAQTLPILSLAIKALTIIQTETIEDLNEICVEWAAKVELFIILGGDGTVHACVNALAALQTRPTLAILPGGTSNDFSRTLGIPQQLRAAAEAIRDGEEIAVDAGKADSHYFLNFWGIGLVTDTSQNVDPEQKQSLGVLSYMMSTLKTLGSAEPFLYKMTIEGKTYEGEAVLVFVLNGRFIGTRELPMSTLSARDGKLNVLIVKRSNLASFRELMAMKNPATNDDTFEEVEHYHATALTITTSPKKEVDMDGELYQTTPSDISILPHHFRMIRSV
ncbi:diacylglycerol/lipid kinase family protein [Lentibacillus saliphilus]|uniref:diacylglycerol/lipid kinase family protein n=1 Tax=Lentibacillus saliphilus TaxID=2737028 RepID=UPI001FEB044D|nr:YegS/Rv2252/BmrU family lipid kinase [Lentibacillus saliphilus]